MTPCSWGSRETENSSSRERKKVIYNIRNICRILLIKHATPPAGFGDANVAAFTCQVNVSACVEYIPNNN